MVRMRVDTSSREPTNHSEIFFLLAKPSMRRKRGGVSALGANSPLQSGPSHLELWELHTCPLPTKGKPGPCCARQMSSLATPPSSMALSSQGSRPEAGREACLHPSQVQGENDFMGKGGGAMSVGGSCTPDVAPSCQPLGLLGADPPAQLEGCTCSCRL